MIRHMKKYLILFLGIIASCLTENIKETQEEPLDIRGKLAFGNFRTTTYTSISLTTSTIFPSCLAGFKDAACGRRKRRNWARSLDVKVDIPDLER